MAGILAADTVTRLGPQHRGQVLVAASHGGLIAGNYAIRAGVRAVIFNDAGIGKDGAGIAALAYLDRFGLPAAAVGHMTSRIADGTDQLARGVLSRVNEAAAALGCRPGQACGTAAALMRQAELRPAEPAPIGEGRSLLVRRPDGIEVWGVDSIAQIEPEDGGRVVICGSHGGLMGGRRDRMAPARLRGLVLNDAGMGADGAGIARLALLESAGVAAAAVACSTARIGEARSSWETGRVSVVNRIAAAARARAGDTVRELVDKLLGS